MSCINIYSILFGQCSHGTWHGSDLYQSRWSCCLLKVWILRVNPEQHASQLLALRESFKHGRAIALWTHDKSIQVGTPPSNYIKNWNIGITWAIPLSETICKLSTTSKQRLGYWKKYDSWEERVIYVLAKFNQMPHVLKLVDPSPSKWSIQNSLSLAVVSFHCWFSMAPYSELAPWHLNEWFNFYVW